jgi:hypothetical protein
VLDAVGKGRREHALPVTSAAFESGRATLVAAETEQRPTVLGLIASGRMRPDTGRVELDGRTDAAGLRRRIALVDAPGVSEPVPDVTLAGVAAEELMFAGRRSDPVAVRRWLDEQGFGDEASVPVSNVSPAGRVRALCELAVLRKGVEAIVLVSPDRHGGEPAAWWAVAEDFAERGFAVLVIAGQASSPVVARVRNERVETRRTIADTQGVSTSGARAPFAQRAGGGVGRPRVPRLTAPARQGRA